MAQHGTQQIASSLDFRRHAEFARRVRPLRVSGEAATPYRQVRLVVRTCWAAAHGAPLILYSNRGRLKPELLACAFIGLWPRARRPSVVMVGELWQPGTGLRAKVERAVVRLADRAIGRYLVPSQYEADLLSQLWPVHSGKGLVLPLYFEPSEHHLRDDEPIAPRGPRIVAGGDSLRDYGPLLEAARRRPESSFLLLTKSLEGVELPPNVEVRRAPYAEYVACLRDAGVVAVPVRLDVQRSAGVLTFLMAMWLNRPTVVTRAPAVDEYVEDGRTGMLVDGTAEGWVTAFDRLLSDQEKAERMSEAAGAAVRGRYTFDAYVQGMLDHLDDVVAGRRTSNGGTRPPAQGAMTA